MAKTQHGSDLTGSELAEMIDEFVNGGATTEATIRSFVEQLTRRTHRTLQQKIMGLFIAAIEGWAALGAGESDPRNEATVKLAKKIIESTGDKYDRHLPFI